MNTEMICILVYEFLDISFACQMENCQKCMPLCTNAWKRRLDRQNFSYLSYKQYLLGHEEITFDPVYIASLAQDQNG